MESIGGAKLTMSDMNILIAGGGTGGHLFPALAIGEEILSRNSNIKIHYVNTDSFYLKIFKKYLN